MVSFGGGVQSIAMSMMASEGEITPMPDHAIFADTRWEPPSVYEQIEWARRRLTFPLLIVGDRSLAEDTEREVRGEGRGFVDIPLWLKGLDGQKDGMGKRQCTRIYKIRPVEREIRRLLGMSRGQRVPAGVTVEMWLGISVDEAIRMKPSRTPWIEHRFPLVEAGLTRQDCAAWLSARYGREIERSACVACPFQSRARWVETRDRHPEMFASAVALDARLRAGHVRYAKEPYLHARRLPLQEAVALDAVELDDRDAFGNECEGHCGL